MIQKDQSVDGCESKKMFHNGATMLFIRNLSNVDQVDKHKNSFVPQIFSTN